MRGLIKIFLRDKNYGFVENEGGEWFFHSSQVIGDAAELRRGDEVEFWLDDDRRRGGLIAVDVRRIQESIHG